MSLSKQIFVVAIEAIAVVALSACGGGGGGSEGAAPAAVTTAPVVTSPAPTAAYQPANSLFGVPSSTSAPASEELAAFSKYNDARTTCGFGALTQSAALDKAAANHVNWMHLNGSIGHSEVAGTPGFTGVTSADRGVYAGYGAAGSFRSSEVFSLQAFAEKTGPGVKLTQNLLSAPYHLSAMMVGHRDVGLSIGVRKASDGSRDVTTLLFDLGYKYFAGPQTLASDDVKTYPCEGVTGVNIAVQNETPNPVPGRDLSVKPIGLSIYIGVRAGNQIAVTSAAITNAATGTQEKVTSILSAKNDPNATSSATYFESNQSVVFTDAPASPNTKYSAVINGTNNGIPFTRTFSFTTGTSGLEN